MRDTPLKVLCEGDEVVIRIGVDTLIFAANGCPVSIFLDDDGHQLYRVSNESDFVKSVIGALTGEDGDGTTLVQKMFDYAFCRVVEQGELGIDEIERRGKGD